LLWILLLLAAGGAASAQTAAEPGPSEVVNALLTRIDRLEQRVAELEASKTPGSTPAPQAP